LTPMPEPEKPEDKPKPDEKELFAVPEAAEPEPVPEVSNEIIPPKGKGKPRGKSKDPEHLKKMREASALRRAERKKEKEEAEKIIAEAKSLKEGKLAEKMTPQKENNFDYDKLAEAMERRRATQKSQAPAPAVVQNTPPPPISAPPKAASVVDYKKKYEQTQVQLFEERVRADERKRIATERQSKINSVARNNMRVPKALQKYQERANQYAETQKDNPWDSFFK